MSHSPGILTVPFYYNSIRQIYPGRRYYPKPSKSVLIVHLDDLETRKLFGLFHGFKVFFGACYLGGFIRDDESRYDWLKNVQGHGNGTKPRSVKMW